MIFPYKIASASLILQAVSWFFCLSVHLVTGYTEYVPEVVLPEIPFDTDIYNFQGNWCKNQVALYAGNTTLKLALEGETIHVVIPNETDYLNLREDGTVDAESPGMYIELMEEVARRGRFKWKFSFHQYIYHVTDYTITDLMVWLTRHFDVVVNWWFELPSRVNRETCYPKGWYDGSIIIIGKSKETKNEFSVFSWGGPFSRNVWILLFLTLLLSGIVHHIVEEGFSLGKWEINEDTTLISRIIQFVQKSFIVFTGHLDLQAKTKPGQLIAFSLSFFAMLMLSSYTANLASFLVNKNTSTDEIKEVGDIVARGMTMCILDAAKKEVIKTLYPHALFVKKVTEADALRGLKNNECDFAITSVSAWEELQNIQEINEDCELERVGRVFKNFEAGFVMQSDAGIHCTTLLREVFHIHFLEMHDDGFIRERWDEHIRRTKRGGGTCLSETKTEEDIETLNLTNVGGIFIVHGVLLLIAIVSSMCGRVYNKRFRERVHKTTLVRSISKKFSFGLDDQTDTEVDNPFTRKLPTENNDYERNDNDVEFLKKQVGIIIDKLDKIASKQNSNDN